MHAARAGGAAYTVRRRGGLRVRRDERLHHRHRGAVRSGQVKGRAPVLCVEHSGDETSLVSDEVAGVEVRGRELRRGMQGEGRCTPRAEGPSECRLSAV